MIQIGAFSYLLDKKYLRKKEITPRRALEYLVYRGVICNFAVEEFQR